MSTTTLKEAENGQYTWTFCSCLFTKIGVADRMNVQNHIDVFDEIGDF
jgi:hypothetical protein